MSSFVRHSELPRWLRTTAARNKTTKGPVWNRVQGHRRASGTMRESKNKWYYSIVIRLSMAPKPFVSPKYRCICVASPGGAIRDPPQRPGHVAHDAAVVSIQVLANVGKLVEQFLFGACIEVFVTKVGCFCMSGPCTMSSSPGLGSLLLPPVWTGHQVSHDSCSSARARFPRVRL